MKVVVSSNVKGIEHVIDTQSEMLRKSVVVLSVSENMIFMLFGMCQQYMSSINTKQMTHVECRLLYLKLQGVLIRLVDTRRS